MDIRELVEGDLPQLLELCRRSLPYDTFTPDLLRYRTLGDPEYTRAYQLCAWEGTRLVGAAIGVRRSGERPAGGILLLAVDPERRRQKIATRLLDELEGRMRADGLAEIYAGGTAPNFFWAGVDMRYTPAYCLLERRGYRTGDVRVNQLVDLTSQSWDTSADEARLAAEGFAVRRLALADREPFSDWMLRVWHAGWRDEALTTYRNDPPTTFVAMRGDAFHGFACYNSEGFDGHFGPTGTDEALRGKGIGRVLFFRCMRDMRESGLERCEVVWVGPIAFYTRVAGAFVHRAFWAMQREL